MNHCSRRATGSLLVTTIAFASVPAVLLARTELVHLRTETSRTFDNGDGTYTAEIVAGPGSFDDSAVVRPDSSEATGTVEQWDFHGYVYYKHVPNIRYDWYYESGRHIEHVFARFGLRTLPQGVEVLSAVLRFHQYRGYSPLWTRIDYLSLDPIEASAQRIFEASGLGVCPSLEHGGVGWVERELNQVGIEALAADISKGWCALRINTEGGESCSGAAHGAGHELEPRIAITYRPTGIREEAIGDARRPTTASVLCGSMILPRQTDSAFLLDITGRKVMDLHPGQNDISRLSPGVYFVHAKAEGGRMKAVHKVVVQR